MKVDAVASPGFTAEYTDETVPLNSVIAVCGDRSALASYASFYGYDYSYMYNTPTSWDAEGRITSAIARAAFDSSARVYYTVGHDELPLGAEMLDSLAKVLKRLGVNEVRNVNFYVRAVIKSYHLSPPPLF